MSTFKLDQDVPMPSRRNRYPFDQMATGQSFEIVGTEESRKVRNAAYQFAKKVNTASGVTKGQPGYVAFALRKTGVVGEGETALSVFRLWRE
jgi:hypothetical protein